MTGNATQRNHYCSVDTPVAINLHNCGYKRSKKRHLNTATAAKTVTKPLANIYDVSENEICSDQGYLFHFYHEYISERTTETRGFKCRAFINISQ